MLSLSGLFLGLHVVCHLVLVLFPSLVSTVSRFDLTNRVTFQRDLKNTTVISVYMINQSSNINRISTVVIEVIKICSTAIGSNYRGAGLG